MRSEWCRSGGRAALVVLVLLLSVTVGLPAPQPYTSAAQVGWSVGNDPGTGIVENDWSAARQWNEALLDAIRTDRPKPPVHARNLFHLSVAMWDAWAAYDGTALGYVYPDKHSAEDVQAAREEALSHAAYRLLLHRFQGTGYNPVDGKLCQPGAMASQEEFRQLMLDLGYDPDNTSTVGDTPAEVGNRIGEAVITYGLGDSALEGADLCYPDDSGYLSLNYELIFSLPGTGTSIIDPNHWTALAFDFLVLQNGIIIGTAQQTFVGVAWGDVAPFGLTDADIQPPDPNCMHTPGAAPAYLTQACPAQLGGAGDEIVKDSMLEMVRYSSYMDPSDPTVVNHSPGVYGNNPVGTDTGQGHLLNPYTGQPYAPNPILRADFARVTAEFWADGPASETPPGHWNTLANYVTDHPDQGDLQICGTGDPVDPLEWDVKMYLALNGAVHDAAVVAWGTKHYYDSARPIALIRYMAEQGQSSDPLQLSYDPDGLPLEPGLVEVITEETIAPGERHEHLAAHCVLGFNDGLPCETDNDCPDDGPFDGQCISSVGQIAIRAWQGGPEDPETEVGGVGWIRAIQWMPYQKATFVTPPFPGYISGHSTFSSAAAEMLTEFTGDAFFPGGLGKFVAEQNNYLSFEVGPTETVELQWATYYDASDEAGASRRYGGIHPYYDDFPARAIGRTIGARSFERALELYNVPCAPTDDADDEGDDEGGDGPGNGDDEDDETNDEEFGGFVKTHHDCQGAGCTQDAAYAGGKKAKQAGTQAAAAEADVAEPAHRSKPIERRGTLRPTAANDREF